MPLIDLNQDLQSHFHLFWDNFPFPVMLVHKDRTILDRNRAAADSGCVLGTRCVERGPLEAHRGCLANQALREQTAKRKVQYVDFLGVVMDSYWIPLPGYDDLFVHFGIDITDYASDRLLTNETKACGEGTGCDCSTVLPVPVGSAPALDPTRLG